MYDKKSGTVSTRKAYELIVSSNIPLSNHGILTQVWKFNIPQKIKCFIWLDLNGKINTWDNLCKKGWLDLNRCSPCKTSAESVYHLFVNCTFAQEVIYSLVRLFDVHLTWTDTSLVENLTSWFSKDGELLYLPIFFIWNMWKTRNNYIF